MGKKLKGVIYARVSSTGDRQDTARQVEELKAYAAKNDIEIDRIFEEHASGAKARKDRHILNECLIYCVGNKTDILLVNELSRLGRNTEDLLANVMFAKQSNLNIYFQKEQFSIFTKDQTPHPFLMIFISVLGTIAEMERENIQYRLQTGRQKYVRDGGKLGRKVGYRKPFTAYESEYPDIFKELKRKDRLSLDRIAKITGHSKNLVIRCATIMKDQYDK